MTPKEKLERLTNPKCVEDYGISIFISELITFDEGRIFVTNLLNKYIPLNKRSEITREINGKGKVLLKP